MRRLCIALLTVVAVACGGSPTTPPPPPPIVDPPANTKPAIDGIAVKGRRAGQPANFADLKEVLDETATVRDPETPLDELIYQWSATAGTITGTGRNVTWTAPDTATTPVVVTITLKVVENYGHPGQAKIFSQDVSGTTTVALHDSAREVGDMSVRFLTEFSKPQTNKDWQDIMRDFNGARCPNPGLTDAERGDVINHYTNFFMHTYNIAAPTVRIAFGEGCAFRDRPGDACAIVSVLWDSTDLRTNSRGQASGLDHIAAAYSSTDRRWWLCSSDFETQTDRWTFYSDR